MNKNEFIPLTKKEFEKLSVSWKEELEFRRDKREKNRKYYYQDRIKLIEIYSGMYIAYSNKKLVGIANTFGGISKFIDLDPTTFITIVGREKCKPIIENIDG